MLGRMVATTEVLGSTCPCCQHLMAHGAKGSTEHGLRSRGMLMQLFLGFRKRAAVEEEDYDVAKQLKQDIDRLRLSADVRPRSSRTSPPLPGRGREPFAHSAGPHALVSSAPSHLTHPEAEGQLASEAAAHVVIPRHLASCGHCCTAAVLAGMAVQQALHLSQDTATASGTDGPRRSTADSPVMPQRSPSHHTEVDASPAGGSSLRCTYCLVLKQQNDFRFAVGPSIDIPSSCKEQCIPLSDPLCDA